MHPAKVSKNDTIARIIRLGLIVLFAVNIVVMGIAIFDTNNYDEAPMGMFGAKEFNEGWTLTCGGKDSKVTLPMYADAEPGEEVILSNTLPMNLSNGMSLMFRASMEDVVISVDGMKRAEYSSQSVRGMKYYIPSAYVVANIDEHDSGKPVTIRVKVKTKGSLNAVTIGHGNNGWFKVIQDGLLVNVIALVAFASGISIILAAFVLGRRYKTNAAAYLGLLVMDVTMWMFSESALRQFIFLRPSLSRFFSYITLELVGALACMYFDEVQHRHYHRRYVIVEAASFILVTVNIILSAAGVAELYETLPLSHVLEAVCAILVFVNVAADIKSGRIRSYSISMLGGIAFIALSLVELARFYFSEFVIFGAYMCLGLIGLMIATILQTIHDVIAGFREHEKQRSVMMNSTIETIAGAIDARDEYTGGHSERVGFYAGALAREMAKEYELSEEDILRIRYIGLVHDIGKIGVADSVLNKAGKLTNEEYSLMKRHTEIGYELMSSMGSEIEGVLDGIRFHHERWDGTGYPDGLAGEDIPLVARILCLADSYDAMTSNRVYRKRLTPDEVRNEFVTCAGSQFDPKLAGIFLRLYDRGDLTEQTVEGMAVDLSGVVAKSAMLETRLQNDLLDGRRIVHPSHVRMLCYMIKLMEKKGRSYQVIFAGPADDAVEGSELSAFIKKLGNAVARNISGHDIIVRYTDRLSIIALYDGNTAGVQAFIARLDDELDGLKTEFLNS